MIIFELVILFVGCFIAFYFTRMVLIDMVANVLLGYWVDVVLLGIVLAILDFVLLSFIGLIVGEFVLPMITFGAMLVLWTYLMSTSLRDTFRKMIHDRMKQITLYHNL